MAGEMKVFFTFILASLPRLLTTPILSPPFPLMRRSYEDNPQRETEEEKKAQ